MSLAARSEFAEVLRLSPLPVVVIPGQTTADLIAICESREAKLEALVAGCYPDAKTALDMVKEWHGLLSLDEADAADWYAKNGAEMRLLVGSYLREYEGADLVAVAKLVFPDAAIGMVPMTAEQRAKWLSRENHVGGR